MAENITGEQRKQIADWIRQHKGEISSDVGDADFWAYYVENTDVNPDEILRLANTNADTILGTTGKTGQVVVNGSVIDLSYLPSYSTSATNAYVDALNQLEGKVKSGYYDSNTTPWSYGKTVDDFMNPDIDKQIQVSKDNAFQKDWLGGNDYGSTILQSQAATNTYLDAYNTALDAKKYDEETSYKLWKDAADNATATKAREYSYDNDMLEYLRGLASDESTTNQMLNETLSNLGINYAAIASNNGTNGNFMDILDPVTRKRLTGSDTTGI